MGLGKTIQALTLLLKLKRKDSSSPVFLHQKSGQLMLFSDEHVSEGLQPATLIILPVSLIHNWEKEIRKFTPSLRTYVLQRNEASWEKRLKRYNSQLRYYSDDLRNREKRCR